MAFVTMLHLQASADAALSCKPGRPVSRGGHGYSQKTNLQIHSRGLKPPQKNQTHVTAITFMAFSQKSSG